MFAISRWLPWLMVLTAVTSITTGCTTTRTHQWQEEVSLSDGSVIRVRREVLYVPGHGEPFRSSKWAVGEERLTILDPPAPTWQGPPQRLAWYLDRRGDYFILVAYQTVCRAGNKQPVWRAYVSSKTGWHEVPLKELETVAKPNLALFARHAKETAHWARLNLAEKSKFDYSDIAPEVKRIEPKSTWACR